MDYDNLICKKYTLTNVRFAHTSIPKTAIFVPQKKKAAGLDPGRKMLVDTAHLMELLDCGKHTAIKIGHSANACVRLDRKLFWNVRCIQKYIDSISE